jgi:tetratricopeptide (TPR) repeat protein
MLFWISLFLAFVSAGVLVFVLFRHWQEIRLLDPDTIRAEQERKARNRIMRERFERHFKRWTAPLRHASRQTLHHLTESIVHMEQRLHQAAGGEQRPSEPYGAEKQVSGGRVMQLIREAQAMAKEGKVGRAERAYLEALKIDMKNVDAYRGLGALYLADRQLKQAKETFDFLVHLNAADGAVYAGLAAIAEAEANNAEAEDYYQKALASEPSALRHAELGEYYLRHERGELALEQAKLARALDPESTRHLELLAEAAILLRSRKEAELAYQTLRIKGCERSVLLRLKEQLDGLEEAEEQPAGSG